MDLRVGEVSLVDTPANEQVFLVAKRLQEDSDMTTGTEQTSTPEADAGASQVSVEVAKAENDAVQAAMGQVSDLVAGIAKAAGVELEQTTEGDVDTEKAGADARKLHQAALTKAGLKGDALKTAMASFDKAMEPKKPPFLKKDEDTKKSAEGDQEVTVDDSQTMEDTVEATLDTISKAKAFTPARVAKLSEALETLQKLLMEVVSPGASPKTKVPAVSTHSNPNTTRTALVGKNEELGKLLAGLDAVVSKMEEIAKPKSGITEADTTKSEDGDKPDVAATLTGIMKRLDAIEGARPAPDSEGDGADGSVDTKKGFWHNVL